MRLSRRRTGATSTSTRQKGTRLFLASPPALRIQQLAGFHFRVPQKGVSTPVLVQGRSFSTSEIRLRARERRIRLLARQRFYLTPPAPTTQPLEQPPF